MFGYSFNDICKLVRGYIRIKLYSVCPNCKSDQENKCPICSNLIRGVMFSMMWKRYKLLLKNRKG